ncbi:MAG: 5-methyltetrahydrofolate--homocysteine methyltransferase, partial [Paraprevotella sp.]|nr:5-methyltetrahydrofolate--homocysteine methyltransferase [Paraprevotella sp.]
GVMLTENGAMRPHASVCGLMISHPMARYFSVGKIGEDQLQEYSKRKSKEKETITKFLSPNIINSLI